MRVNDPCHNCDGAGLDVFYEAKSIPVHSMLLLDSKDQAQAYPKRDLRLGFCASCGFIQNTVFDPTVHEYSTKFEESQGFSETFNVFARDLAGRLIERYRLRGKEVLEIGCGKGDFLALICELGENRGTGVDPGVIPGRASGAVASRMTLIQDFYSEKYAHLTGDMVLCRHTLEHIQPTRKFLQMVKASLGGSREKIVVFEVPDVVRVLKEQAFWDIYYEHCSYYSLGSLARLFRSCGFEILDLWKGFGDQYLVIEARIGNGTEGRTFPGENDLADLTAEVQRFKDDCRKRVAGWRNYLEKIKRENRRAVAWGSGSKSVAFLTTLHAGEEIGGVVDINPHRQGWHMPGTGHKIVPPEFLRTYKPDNVIVMNPLYKEEIRRDLEAMGLSPEIEAV